MSQPIVIHQRCSHLCKHCERVLRSDYDASLSGIDSVESIRETMIEWRARAMDKWPEAIETTLLMSHVIWWLSELQDVRKEYPNGT